MIDVVDLAAQRGIEDLLLDRRVDLQRGADAGDEIPLLRLAAGIVERLEHGIDRAVVGLEQGRGVDRLDLGHRLCRLCRLCRGLRRPRRRLGAALRRRLCRRLGGTRRRFGRRCLGRHGLVSVGDIGDNDEAAALVSAALQQPYDRPDTSPSASSPMPLAAGTRGSPGMVRMSPQIATTKPAPAASRTSRTVTT